MSSQTTSGSIIFHWLERIGLGYAIPTFQAMGITSTQAFMSLTVEDYDAGIARLFTFPIAHACSFVLQCVATVYAVFAVGVTEVQDRKRLFELVTRVREVCSPCLTRRLLFASRHMCEIP
jgi:hypothetical protein